MAWRDRFRLVRNACTSPPLRWAARFALVTLAVFSASWVGLLNFAGIDEWFERQFFRLVSHAVTKPLNPAVRVLYLDESHRLPALADGAAELQFGDAGRREAWRAWHARLLHELERAGARVVAFDQYFPSPRREYAEADSAFAEAVGRVQRAGRMRVVLGLRSPDFTGPPGMSEPLRRATADDQKALIDVGGHVQELGELYLRHVLIAVAYVEEGGSSVRVRSQRLIPSLALQAAIAYRSREISKPVRARLDLEGRALVLEADGRPIQTIRCDLRRLDEVAGRPYYATIPLHLSAELELQDNYARPYTDAFGGADLSEYSGSIVLVGARLEGKRDEGIPGELFSIASGRQVYGYQVHAGILSDLLDGSYPRRLGPGARYLVILVLAAAAAAGRRFLSRGDIDVPLPFVGKRGVPVALLLLAAVYAIVIIQLYRSGYLVFEPGYDLAALAAGYYVCARNVQHTGQRQGTAAAAGAAGADGRT